MEWEEEEGRPTTRPGTEWRPVAGGVMCCLGNNPDEKEGEEEEGNPRNPGEEGVAMQCDEHTAEEAPPAAAAEGLEKSVDSNSFCR